MEYFTEKKRERGRKWITDAHNLDRSQGHCAKWKRPILKGYILYVSIYITLLKWQDYSYEEQFRACQVRNGRWYDYKVLHEGDICVHRIVLHPDCGDSYINIHMWHNG